MTLVTYLLYVAAVALLIVTPGPTMLMCMTNSLNHGARHAMTSVTGAATAVLGVMVLLALIFVMFEFAVLTLCAFGVARLLPLLRSTRAVRWFDRVCGGLFTLLGGLLLFTRRSA